MWLNTFVNRNYRDDWVAQIARQQPAGSRVLDVGAGSCPYRKLFAHCDYKAHDFCEYGGTVYDTIDYVCDITKIPAPAASFDAVLCTEVFEHVPDPLAALHEIARLVKPRGMLYLSAPLGAGLHQEPYHFYGGFTPYFYRKFLPEAGFDIVSLFSNGGFFRLQAQETMRARNLLLDSSHWYRPEYWLAKVALRVLAHWYVKLDDRISVKTFTVGYHVVARKRAAALPTEGSLEDGADAATAANGSGPILIPGPGAGVPVPGCTLHAESAQPSETIC